MFNLDFFKKEEKLFFLSKLLRKTDLQEIMFFFLGQSLLEADV